MPIVNTIKMNASQYLQLGEDPPGVRLELVDGEVAVSPSAIPDHAFVIAKLLKILGNHIDDNNLGQLFQDVDTILDPYNVRRPDILYFSNARLHLIGKKAMEGPPDLAVEVLSPSSVTIDREDKFEQYARAGVMNYWIIDPTERTVEAWTLSGGNFVPAVTGRDVGLIPLPPFPDLEIAIEQLWRK